MSPLKIFFLSAVLISSSLHAATLVDSDESIYEELINQFEEPALSVLSYDDLKGAYVGRCAQFDNPNETVAALLVITQKMSSDNGPLFPPSYEKRLFWLGEWSLSFSMEQSS